MPEPKDLRLNVKMDTTGYNEAVPFSNIAAVSRVGREVQMDFGLVDINELAAAMEQSRKEGKESTVNAKLIKRVIMSVDGLALLRDRINQMFSRQEAPGARK